MAKNTAHLLPVHRAVFVKVKALEYLVGSENLRLRDRNLGGFILKLKVEGWGWVGGGWVWCMIFFQATNQPTSSSIQFLQNVSTFVDFFLKTFGK